MQESRRFLEAAFDLLGARIPRGAGLLPGLVVQILREVGRRFLSSRDSRARETRGSTLEAARTVGVLFIIYYQANDAIRTVFAALSGLDLAERMAPSPELASSLSTLCLVAGTLPIHPAAAWYRRRALALAESLDHPATVAWVLEVSAVYQIGLGRWGAVQSETDRALSAAAGIGDERRLEEARAVQAWLSSLVSEKPWIRMGGHRRWTSPCGGPPPSSVRGCGPGVRPCRNRASRRRP
jgi:hypothetical protein